LSTKRVRPTSYSCRRYTCTTPSDTGSRCSATTVSGWTPPVCTLPATAATTGCGPTVDAFWPKTAKMRRRALGSSSDVKFASCTLFTSGTGRCSTQDGAGPRRGGGVFVRDDGRVDRPRTDVGLYLLQRKQHTDELLAVGISNRCCSCRTPATHVYSNSVTLFFFVYAPIESTGLR